MLDLLLTPFLLLTPSWSTYLNLLFFQLTWTTLVLSHPPLPILLLGTLALKLLLHLLPSLLFTLFDSLLPSLSTPLKSSPPASQSPRIPLIATTNTLLTIALLGVLECTGTYLLTKPPLRVQRTLPLPGEIAQDLFLLLALREVGGYYTHRFLLHQNLAGGWLSRSHKAWQHSRRTCSGGFMASYDHPVCHLLQQLPGIVPALILRAHVLTWLLFTALSSAEEAVVYSGYDIRWTMLGNAARRTDRHFASGGKGNYSPWGVLDWAHGTTVGPDVKNDVGEAVEKHKERKGKNQRRRKE